jgi:hypothetical protein
MTLCWGSDLVQKKYQGQFLKTKKRASWAH